MRRSTDFAKEFMNGNINIKLDKETLINVESGKFSDIEVVSWALDSIDCYIISDEYCLSNYEVGCTVYNFYSNLIYILPFSLLEEMKKGKMIKLYARVPNENEREQINEYFN